MSMLLINLESGDITILDAKDDDDVDKDVLKSVGDDTVVLIKGEVIRGEVHFRKALVAEKEDEDEGEEELEIQDWELLR